MRGLILSYFVVLFIAVFAWSSVVLAAGNIPASCSSDYYDVLRARSWLEGKREMEAAQFFILKPDSVLEYSCFDEEVKWLAAVADRMFSDNVTSGNLFNSPALSFSPKDSFQPTITSPTGPNPPGGMDNHTLDNMLQLLVLDALNAYLSTNFGHTLGGGTVANGGGFCGAMNYVWHELKCANFDTSYFMTFSELAAFDPRTRPVACGEANRTAKWNAAIAAAFPVPATPAALGGMDAVVSYNSKIMLGASCLNQPIPTGVIIDEDGSGPGVARPDAVCSTPGCYYDSAANDCKP